MRGKSPGVSPSSDSTFLPDLPRPVPAALPGKWALPRLWGFRVRNVPGTPAHSPSGTPPAIGTQGREWGWSLASLSTFYDPTLGGHSDRQTRLPHHPPDFQRQPGIDPLSLAQPMTGELADYTVGPGPSGEDQKSRDPEGGTEGCSVGAQHHLVFLGMGWRR